MKALITGVSKGGVQKFNGHLYWFSWQVTTYLYISNTSYLCSGQRCQCEERQVGLVQRQELLQVGSSSHSFIVYYFFVFRKRCMDLVSFETQQEYDWVKGFINGELRMFL